MLDKICIVNNESKYNIEKENLLVKNDYSSDSSISDVGKTIFVRLREGSKGEIEWNEKIKEIITDDMEDLKGENVYCVYIDNYDISADEFHNLVNRLESRGLEEAIIFINKDLLYDVIF